MDGFDTGNIIAIGGLIAKTIWDYAVTRERIKYLTAAVEENKKAVALFHDRVLGDSSNPVYMSTSNCNRRVDDLTRGIKESQREVVELVKDIKKDLSKYRDENQSLTERIVTIETRQSLR